MFLPFQIHLFSICTIGCTRRPEANDSEQPVPPNVYRLSHVLQLPAIVIFTRILLQQTANGQPGTVAFVSRGQYNSSERPAGHSLRRMIWWRFNWGRWRIRRLHLPRRPVDFSLYCTKLCTHSFSSCIKHHCKIHSYVYVFSSKMWSCLLHETVATTSFGMKSRRSIGESWRLAISQLVSRLLHNSVELHHIQYIRVLDDNWSNVVGIG